MSHIIGWACIGLAAALVGAIWPFRRGTMGFVVNVAVAVVGAIGGALLGFALGLYGSPRDPVGLPFAGLGALILLLAAHLVWTARPTVAQRLAHGRVRR